MEIILRVITVIIAVFTVLTLGTILGLLLKMPDLPEHGNSNKICLPSGSKGDIQSQLQCGEMVDLLHKYMEDDINENFKQLETELEDRQASKTDTPPIGLKQFLEANYWEMKPAARFIGIQQPNLKPADYGSELVPIREWLHGPRLHDNGGYQRYGMKYRSGRIIVPVAGTYNIYSFVDMYEPCIPDDGVPDIEDRNGSIKHAIFKFNILEEVETELIHATQPHYISANGYFNIYSSYISSIVQLNAGDELVVKVSNISYIKYPEVNYFGVNLI